MLRRFAPRNDVSSGGEALDEIGGGRLEARHLLVDMAEIARHPVDLAGDVLGVLADRFCKTFPSR